MRAPRSMPLAHGAPAIPNATLLLVEDDAGDALLVRELLDEVGAAGELVHAETLAQATRLLDDGQVGCVLLDLNLPDSEGFEGLRLIVEAAPQVPVIVLTGLVDRDAGQRALAFGAQDYLVKGEVDGALLLRAIRYARERKQAAGRLAAAEMGRMQNARVLRGLLPRPLVGDDSKLRWSLRYLPGGEQSELGGDFVDVVERADGSLRIVIGDVCGHGPDEAALGASLRIAWRTLVLGGRPDDEVLGVLEEVLIAERLTDLFTTVCDLTITPDRRHACLRLAGHPAPIFVGTDQPEIAADQRGVPLGVVEGAVWPEVSLDLAPGAGLLCFTDGLIEGASSTSRVLGENGLGALVDDLALDDLQAALDLLVARVQEHNGGPLDDDLAALLLCL